MLGDPVGEERGQITGTRVLPASGPGPRVEVSFQASGQSNGVSGTMQAAESARRSELDSERASV